MCYTETKGKPPENGNSVGGKKYGQCYYSTEREKNQWILSKLKD